MKRLKGCLWGALALGLMGLLLGWLFFPPSVNLPPSVRDHLARRIREKAGVDLRSDRLVVDHAQGRAEIGSVSLSMPGEPPFLRARQADLGFASGTGLADLVLGRAGLEEIRVEGAVCDLKAPHPDLTMAPGSAGSTRPMIRRIGLTDLTIVSWAGEFGIESFDGTFDPAQGTGRFAIHVVRNPFGGELHATGSIGLGSQPATLEMRVRGLNAGTLPGLMWLQFLYGVRLASGTVDADLTWSGPLSRWVGSGSIDLRTLVRQELTGRVAWRGTDFAWRDLAGVVTVDLERPTVDAASFSASLAAATGTVVVRGAWDGTAGSPGRIGFQATTAGLQIQPQWLTAAHGGQETGLNPGLIDLAVSGWSDGTHLETAGMATATGWAWEGKPIDFLGCAWNQRGSAAEATFTADLLGTSLQGGGSLARRADGEIAGDFSGTAEDLDLEVFRPWHDGRVGGICRGPFHLSFPTDDGKMAYQADLQVQQPRVMDLEAGYLEGTLTGSGGDWEVRDPRAVFANGGEIALHGRIGVAGFEAGVTCEQVDLSMLRLAPGIASGLVSFAGRLSGPLGRPLLHGNLWATGVGLFGLALDTFKGGLQITPDRLILDPILATSRTSGALDGFLAFDLHKKRLANCRLAFQDLDLVELRPHLGEFGRAGLLAGRISGTVHFGALTGTEGVEFNLSSRNLVVASESLDACQVEGAIHGGQGEIRKLRVEAFGGSIDGSGRFLDLETFVGSLRANRLQVQKVAAVQAWLPQLRGEITLDGSLNWSPAHRTGRFSLFGNELWIKERELGNLGAEVVIDPEGLRITQASFDRIGVSGTGTLGWAGRKPYQGTLTLKSTDLSFIPLAHGWSAFGKDDLIVDGQCRVTGDLASGTPDVVHAELARVEIRRGKDLITAARPMEILFQNGIFELRQFELGFQKGLIGLQGTYEPGGPMALTIAGSDFSLKALGNLLELRNWLVDGTLSLQGSLHGTPTHPQLKGTMAVRDLAIAGRVIPEVKAVCALTPQDLRLQEFVVALPHNRLQAAGTVPLGPATDSRGMDLRLEIASGPLVDLPVYLPELFHQASGTVAASFHLTGNPRQPALAGDLHLAAQSLAFRGMRTPLKDVVVEARTRDGVVEVSPVAAKLGRGLLTGLGKIDFQDGLGSLTADLRGEKLDFSWGGVEARSVGITVSARGDLYNPVVRAVVKIPRGKVLISENLMNLPITQLPLPLQTLDYRVDFEIPRNVWVRNSFINAEMRGKVGLAGSLDSFRIDGGVQCVQGWLFFQRRKFQVETGELRFGAREGTIDPHLFLKSSTNVQNTQIYLTLEGQMSSFTPRLYSSPPMSEGDLFALLTLGRSLEQAQQSDPRQLFEKEILEGLKNTYLSGLLGSTLSTALNLDELYLGSLFDRSTGITRSFLRIGKYLGHNFFVAYEGTMSNEGQKIYILEYRLPRGFLLNLEFEKPLNRTRIGVQYDWKF